MNKPLVLVSSCLLGNKVRYDGRHKYNPYLEPLRDHLNLVPICPEAMIGLGIPRPPIKLQVQSVTSNSMSAPAIRAVGRDDQSLDVTQALVNAGTCLAKVYHDQLCGIICQSRSPSCGNGSVPIEGEALDQPGDGLFISSLKTRLPWLPIIEDTDLEDHKRIHSFLQHCQWLHQWQSMPGDIFRKQHEDEIKNIQHAHFVHTLEFLRQQLSSDQK